MKWLGKGRTVHWILNLFLGLSSLCILPAVAQDEVSGVSGSSVMGLVKFQKDSSAAGAFSFESKEQALDTLIVWLLMKKPSMATGFMPKDLFVAQWRSHDTVTLKQVVEGGWLTHQFRFKKSLLKTQLKMKQSKVNFKMVEVVPRPRVTESVAGDGITKYDYTVKYKKLKYVLSFQLWWIDGKGYWVNEVSWMMGV